MAGLINSFWFNGVDSDCVAFNSAVGTLDSTEEAAICALVSTLKSDGIWDKCYAIYPFAGTTAAEQKWQLKDPRDLNAAYRITFSANWTHSITGALMTTSTATAETYLNANTVMTATDCGLTFACRSNAENNQYAFGTAVGGSTNIHTLSRTSLVGGRCATSSFTGSAPADGVAEGVVTCTRSGTTQNSYKAGALEGGPTTVSGSTLISNTLQFGMGNTMEFCFGVAHQGLDATEVANLHTAIDTYSATYTGRKNW